MNWKSARDRRREAVKCFTGDSSLGRSKHQYLWAMSYVKQGYKMRRACWRNDDPSTARLYVEKPRSRVTIITADGKTKVYRPSQNVVLTSNDWVHA